MKKSSSPFCDFSGRAGSLRLSLALAFAALPCAATQAQYLPPGGPTSTLVMVRDTGELTTSTLGAVSSATPDIAVTGIAAGHTLVAIDIRPQTQGLYGLTVNATSDQAQLVHISLETGAATGVGPEFGFTIGGNTVDLPANQSWDIDFNPAVDRLRVVSSSGLNFRVNPNTGAPVDAFPGSNGINPDDFINGAATGLQGAAYTNSQPNADSFTTLYTLDPVTNNLCIQNPPNNGTQVNPVTVKLNGSELDFSAVSGFDIPHNVSVATANAVANGSGYAVLTVGGMPGFYKINLATGSATLLSAVTPRRSFTFRPQLGVGVGLRPDGQAFAVFSPTDTTLPTLFYGIPALTPGETLAALDVRPSTGQLYGLGVNATNNTASLYIMDLKGGQPTLVGAASSIAFVGAGGATVNLPELSTGYDMDFNPTADRLRVVTSDGLNFRVNPNTGAPVDGDSGGSSGSMAGVNPDGYLNGAAIGLNALGYTNSYAGATVTMAYGMDFSTTRLFVLSPPNAGTLTTPVTVTDGSRFGIATQRTTTLDIYAGTTLANPITPGSPVGYFNALPAIGGGSRMYRLDLATGRATLARVLEFESLSSLALYSVPPRGPLATPYLLNAMVGEDYEAFLDLLPGTTVTAKGLPPGLKLNSATGAISGRVTTAGAYVVTFTVKDSTGALTTHYATLTVISIPKGVIGIYTGLVEPHAAVNESLGGRVDITTTTKGTFTAKLQQGTKTFSATGNLITAAGGTPRLQTTFKNGPTLRLDLGSGDLATGVLIKEADNTPVSAWRKTFDKVLNPADAEAGYYSIAIDAAPALTSLPGGTGFAAISVGLDGTVKLTGKAADGSPLTTTVPLGPQGQILVHVPLYKKLGSLQGTLTVNSEYPPLTGNYILGDLYLTRPAIPGRLYPQAVTHARFLAEGQYLAKAATGSIVLGLPAPGIPASLVFTEAAVETSDTVPDLLETVNYVLPKALLPTAGSTGNPARVSLTINPANGSITGTFTLQDGAAKRSVKYEGMIIRRIFSNTSLGSGFFLLPQLPLSNTSPFLSGKVDLVR